MRIFQFWVLLIGSVLIFGMVYKQNSLSMAIKYQQQTLVDDREVIDQGTGYKSAWETMARFIYESGKTDPKLMDVLKKNHIGVGPQPMTNAAPMPVPPAAAPTHP